MKEAENEEELVAELRQRQRNIVFPDTLRGGTSVDALLWHGDPKAPPIQRWGMRVWGAFFCVGGMGVLAVTCDRPDGVITVFIGSVIGLSFMYAGVRTLRRSFLRGPHVS